MQSALRLAARRAAGAASRRGVATTTITTTTEAERERVASLIQREVQREVRAQMLVAEERAAAERARAMEAEWSARLRAFKLQQETPWYASSAWMNGYLAGYMVWFTMFIILR